jgi:poly-beta-1,6-N-acetyl-D-glucosamine synthase
MSANLEASPRKYALVTPARNEEACIQATIEAVVFQTIPPQKWIIVSDGSVDRTDEIVRAYAREFPFIQLLRIEEQGHRDFRSKVRAFAAGYGQLQSTDFDFIGNLDADVTFAPEYYEQILREFEANQRLGLAGGIVSELVAGKFVKQIQSARYSVAGAVQLFRRDCYESIGGYVPISRGGIDTAAEIMARMHGWEVQTFPEMEVHHHRRMSTGGATIVQTRFRRGISNYILGYHPLFQIAASLSRLGERPYLVGSVCTLLGYGWSCLRHYKRALPGEAVKFLRAEQLARLTPTFVTHRLIGGN